MHSTSKSHPAIRFDSAPVLDGPLAQFEFKREEFLTRVESRIQRELSQRKLEPMLEETLYLERMRLKKYNKFKVKDWYIQPRLRRDRKLWGSIYGGLLKHGSEADRSEMLARIIDHYTSEIGNRFDPNVYVFATKSVPLVFNWLLNAASVHTFLPWKQTVGLESRLTVLGEIPHLQKLSQKGTILLVPTHQSNIDSILIGYLIFLMGLPPFAYGAGLNLFSNPLLSFSLSNLGAYTVDRLKNNDIYKNALKNYSTEMIKSGVHSIFYPAGGRSRSGAIESRLKLGLLGTGLQAQIENLREGKRNPKVFVVPMTLSYHFVLEASSLIEDFLAASGKHRFLPIDDGEPFLTVKVLNFFWKLFSGTSSITTRIGRPLDVFGNLVDEEGQSIGPNGTTIDAVKWLTTKGELRAEHQRDREYTEELGRSIATRYHDDNTVLTSHLATYSYFSCLKKAYPDFDLYRLLRLTTAQRSIPVERFYQEAERIHDKVVDLASRSKLFIEEDLKTTHAPTWVNHALKEIGTYHSTAVIKIENGVIFTEDMSLLYYYRNRLTGYGLEEMSGEWARGGYDSKGFLV